MLDLPGRQQKQRPLDRHTAPMTFLPLLKLLYALSRLEVKRGVANCTPDSEPELQQLGFTPVGQLERSECLTVLRVSNLSSTLRLGPLKEL